MCVLAYLHVYVCMQCMCIHGVCTSMFTHMHMCIYTCVCGNMWQCIQLCVYVCVHIHVYVGGVCCGECVCVCVRGAARILEQRQKTAGLRGFNHTLRREPGSRGS